MITVSFMIFSNLVKRAVRALESEEYKKLAAKNNNDLPDINTRQDALEALRLLPMNQLAFRVRKLETEEALKQNLKPESGVPVLQIVPQQEFLPDLYYCWFYEPTSLKTYALAALALITIFAVVLFPLWPMKMRLGVWYLSLACLGLLGLLFAIAILRLILFVITYFVLSPGLWLFPNLFADVSVVESFIPFWAWHGDDTLPKPKPKKKKKKVDPAKKAENQIKSDAAEQLTSKLNALGERVQQLKKEMLNKDGPKSPEEIKQLEQALFVQEMNKLRDELQGAAATATNPAVPVPATAPTTNNVGSAPAKTSAISSTPVVKRKVILEDA